MSVRISFLVIFLISLGTYYTLPLLISYILPYNNNHHVLAVGNYQAVVIPQQIPVETLKPLLPQDIELVADKIQDGKYIVLYTFGFQKSVRPVFGGITLNYLESVLAVPFVRFNAEYKEKHGINTTFTFLPRLYLNDTYGIWMGKLYGLAKIKGHMSSSSEEGSNHYHISDYDDNTDVLNVQWKPVTPWKTSKDFPYTKQFIEGALDLPLIAESGLGMYLSSVFDWKFHESSLRGISGKLTFHQSYVGELPTGQFEFTGLDSGYIGAYELNTEWTLSLPYLSRHM
ncbi:uncharacterized protein LOC144438805 [Glandiceps talaboti]